MDDNKIREIRLIRENPRFRRYPEYKESGVEWIGEIPAHWKILPFMYCLEKVKTGKKTSIPKMDYQESGEFPVIDQGASFIAGWTDLIDSVISDNLPVVIFGDHTRIFKYVDFPFALGADGTQLLYPNDDILNPRFFYYALLNLIIPNEGYSRHYKYLREFSVACPALPTQTQIANFLDRKTEQIDELIRIKERRIELLQEQRTALINQAVTTGLDPNVEMKSSGVEWIGEIPAHWESKRLGHVSTIFKGGTPKRNVDRYFQGDLPWARPVDITALRGALYIHDTEIHISEEALGNSGARRLPAGTVLLTSRATIGETAIATVPMATNQGFANFVCNKQLLNIYLAYYLRAIKELLISLGSGSTFLEVTKGTLVGVGIPLPSLSEQKQIVNFLDSKTEQIDDLIATEQRKIELLREYRQSLISEAVTGKIDVRHEV